MQEQEARIEGYDCKLYRIRFWDEGHIPTAYDHFTFYIFDKEKQAKKALAEIKEKSFREITDEGENYVRGWLDGVVDADIENYYYINGNLMVAATVTSVDQSARDVNDPTSPVWGGGQTALDIINTINDYF